MYYVLGKYGITEHPPPNDPKKVMALKKKNPFKHVKVAQMKEVHKRLRSFIRLVDFLIQDSLRRLVLTAVGVLEHQFTMSSSRKQQLDLYNLCGWKNDNENQQYACNVESVPTFEVNLVLTEGVVKLFIDSFWAFRTFDSSSCLYAQLHSEYIILLFCGLVVFYSLKQLLAIFLSACLDNYDAFFWQNEEWNVIIILLLVPSQWIDRRLSVVRCKTCY